MNLLINPNIAYLLLVTAVVLLLWTSYHPTSTWPKVWMALCFLAGGYEFLYLKGNPWAFLVVALSPVPFLVAVRQSRTYSPLVLITILMLTLGSAFLFVDQQGKVLVSAGVMGIFSVFGTLCIWIVMGGIGKAQSALASDDPDSLVGMIGEVRTDIEPYSTGSVMVEGELWRARSKEFIPAGRVVRVLRQDAYLLTVKETQKLTKK
jgi:membrane-bound serine protease (ClpP class)